MGIGSAGFTVPSGGVVAVKSIGRSEGRRPFIAVGGGSASRREGAGQGWDCDPERNGRTGITP